MDISKLQEDLKVKGYTQFNLRDINEELYNQLLPFKCNETTNLKEYMIGLRMDGELLSKNDNINHIREVLDTHNESIQLRESTIPLMNPNNIFQIWHYNELINYNWKDIKPNYTDVMVGIFKVVRTIFGINETIGLKSIVNEITYYDKGCFITDHRDGLNEDRVCSILIYLNETYNEEDGGILILDGNEKVIPEFGNVAVISLSNFDVSHRVTPVVGGIGRYAICTFVAYHNKNNFI